VSVSVSESVTMDNIYMSVHSCGFNPVICDDVSPDSYKGLVCQGESGKYQAHINSRNIQNIQNNQKISETMNSFDVSFV
jgi:hypothetical protein